jgi:hypothetical protein
MTAVADGIIEIMVWGMVAALSTIAVLYASQNLGWTRLNLAFLLGSAFSENRRSANALGFLLYLVIGWFVAFFYYLVFVVIGAATWWIGAITGFVHGMLLLTAFFPLLPYVHPRIASEYDGPNLVKRLEPPGFLGLHYGYRTPVIALLAQVVYGVVLGFGFSR